MTLEKKLGYNEAVHQLFMHFNKTCLTVRRKALQNILIEFGIPRKLVRLIKMSFIEGYIKFHIGRTLSDTFYIQNGLKH
jgi:hypothetical protein